MATGDQNDMAGRLAALLPVSWFQGSVPVLSVLLAGLGNGLALVYSLTAYARLQTRIGTASDGWLDLISADFFGATPGSSPGQALPRRTGELDSRYRARILAQLLRERATRNGMIGMLTVLTGRVPLVFEPERPADTGGWGGGCGYGVAGGWGSVLLPAQVFVTAFRPTGTGVPIVAGYGIPTGAYATAGQAEYAAMAMIQGAVTDADIYAAVDATKPAGTTAWTSISS